MVELVTNRQIKINPSNPRLIKDNELLKLVKSIKELVAMLSIIRYEK